jgi:hypothetical protein
MKHIKKFKLFENRKHPSYYLKNDITYKEIKLSLYDELYCNDVSRNMEKTKIK